MLETLKRNIRLIRESRNLSREQLAEMMDVDDNVVKRLEWGKSSIDIERLDKFAECLNIKLIDVLTFPNRYIDSNSVLGYDDKIEAILQIKLSKSQNEKTIRVESFELK